MSPSQRTQKYFRVALDQRFDELVKHVRDFDKRFYRRRGLDLLVSLIIASNIPLSSSHKVREGKLGRK